MEEGRSAFKILTDKPRGKRSLRRPRRKWEKNVRICQRNTRNLIDSAHDREYWRSLVDISLNIRVPLL